MLRDFHRILMVVAAPIESMLSGARHLRPSLQLMSAGEQITGPSD